MDIDLCYSIETTSPNIYCKKTFEFEVNKLILSCVTQNDDVWMIITQTINERCQLPV